MKKPHVCYHSSNTSPWEIAKVLQSKMHIFCDALVEKIKESKA